MGFTSPNSAPSLQELFQKKFLVSEGGSTEPNELPWICHCSSSSGCSVGCVVWCQWVNVPSCVIQIDPLPMPTLSPSAPAFIRFWAWATVTTKHTYTHGYTRWHRNTHTQVYTATKTHTHICIPIHGDAETCIHRYTWWHRNTHTQVYMVTQKHTLTYYMAVHVLQSLETFMCYVSLQWCWYCWYKPLLHHSHGTQNQNWKPHSVTWQHKQVTINFSSMSNVRMRKFTRLTWPTNTSSHRYLQTRDWATDTQRALKLLSTTRCSQSTAGTQVNIINWWQVTYHFHRRPAAMGTAFSTIELTRSGNWNFLVTNPASSKMTHSVIFILK